MVCFLAIFILLIVGWGLRDYFVSIGIVLVVGASILYKYEEIKDRKKKLK